MLLPRHSAKGQALPSGLTTTLGKREGFCQLLCRHGTRQSPVTVSWLSLYLYFYREPSQHSAKALRSAQFLPCCGKSTRQRGRVCRVLLPRHSAKGQALPSGFTMTLGKRAGFANCFAVMALDKALSPSVGCLYIFIFIESLLSTRQKHCRVPDRKHSANSSLPSSWLLCDVCRRRHMANLCPVFTNNRKVYLCLYKLL